MVSSSTGSVHLFQYSSKHQVSVKGFIILVNPYYTILVFRSTDVIVFLYKALCSPSTCLHIWLYTQAVNSSHYSSQVLQPARAYLGSFCMKQLGVLLLPPWMGCQSITRFPLPLKFHQLYPLIPLWRETL